MAIHDLAIEQSDPTERSDICVVGAGVVGLLLATRLARRNVRVVLIESGGYTIDPAVQALNQIEDPAGRYAFAAKERNRGWAQSSWDGCMIPISATDASAREHIGQTEWPIELAGLEQYRFELEDMFSVGHGSYEDIDADAPGASGLLINNVEDFTARWAKYPTHRRGNITTALIDELKSSTNATAWLNATACAFELDRGQGRLTAVIARSLSGHTLTIAAKEFVFAAGTIESTRLLLLLDEAADNHPFAGTGALGRYFQDQLHAELASVDRQRSELTSHLLNDRFVGGVRRELQLELSRSAQEHNAVASAVVYASRSPTDAAPAIANRIGHGAHRGWNEAHQLREAVHDFGQVATGAFWRIWYHQDYTAPEIGFRLMSRIEQLAHPLNRIKLASPQDPLGVPKALCEWEPRPPDEWTFQSTVRHLGRYWQRSGFDILCPLMWSPSVTDPNAPPIIENALPCAHPSGSTRMGADPTTSVVGPDLRCHAVPNLAIASASVFPASGSSDPAFTLMQLALWLADSYLPAISTARSTAAKV